MFKVFIDLSASTPYPLSQPYHPLYQPPSPPPNFKNKQITLNLQVEIRQYRRPLQNTFMSFRHFFPIFAASVFTNILEV